MERNMSHSSEMAKLVRKLRKAGYQVTFTGSGHYKVTGPESFVILSMSPRRDDIRPMMKLLKRIGYEG